MTTSIPANEHPVHPAIAPLPQGALAAGVDILEVDRMRRCMGSSRFMQRVFSKEELEYFALRKFPAETVAGNFCAKEAFSKALGSGVRGFSLTEVAALRDSLGKPYYRLSGNAARIADGYMFTLSISHTRSLAIAFTVMYAVPDFRHIE